MIADLKHQFFRKLNSRFFYGWVILAVTTVVMFGSGAGQSHWVGLFFEPLSDELGLSRTAVALAYGGATFVAAFFLPRLGRVIDRYGAARTLLVIAVVLSISCIGFAATRNWTSIAVGFALVRFLGQGALALCCVNLVSQWFSARRGFAMGLMALGFPLSMAIHPPLGQWAIDHIGWRETWIWMGASTAVLLIPAVALFLFSKPEQVGLAPDGKVPSPNERATAGAISGLTLAQALREPAFYIIGVSLFSLSMLVTALHVENKGLLMAHGLSAQTAALMFTVTGVVAAAAMPIVGWMLDRFPTERMLVGGLLIMVGSLWSVTFVSDLKGAVVYAIIFGINNGVTMTYFAFLWPRFFGRKHLGSIQGTGQMVGIVGASLGPLPLAIAIDSLGGYDTMLRVLSILPLACAIAALSLREPKGLNAS
ncbi:MAG: MFS transporter [Pseudomonadota bacterium]